MNGQHVCGKCGATHLKAEQVTLIGNLVVCGQCYARSIAFAPMAPVAVPRLAA